LGELRKEKPSGSSGSDVPIALTEITLLSTILQRAQHNDATMPRATMQQFSMQQFNVWHKTCNIQHACDHRWLTSSTGTGTIGYRPPTGYADRAVSMRATAA
jgi:hypothetical protein